MNPHNHHQIAKAIREKSIRHPDLRGSKLLHEIRSEIADDDYKKKRQAELDAAIERLSLED
jgi:hypothetical protein